MLEALVVGLHRKASTLGLHKQQTHLEELLNHLGDPYSLKEAACSSSLEEACLQ